MTIIVGIEESNRHSIITQRQSLNNRRSLIVALSGLLAAALGTLWWRRRSIPADTITAVPLQVPLSATDTPAKPSIEAVPQAPAVPMSIVLALRLVSAAFGLLCLTQAQSLLLASRMPIQPLALFVVGVVLLLPLTANHTLEADAVAVPPLVRESGETNGKSRRAFYVAAATFFVVVSMLIAQFGRLTSLLLVTWALGILAALAATISIRVEWSALIREPRLWHQIVPQEFDASHQELQEICPFHLTS